MKKIIYLSAATLIFAGIAWLIQSHLYLNGDVAYLLHVTQRFLSGGHYIQDFYETNPPMILYLYSPVFLLAKMFSIDVTQAVLIYVILLGVFSCFLSFYFLQKIIKKNALTESLLVFAILFSVFILPAKEFGQREHFFIMLFLPYVFSAVWVAEGFPINKMIALLVGILAALGVGLKPYFLIPVVFIEIYLMWARKQFFSWWRMSAVAIGVVLVIYLGTVFWLQPNYIHQMLPLISDFYFIGTEDPWLIIFSCLPVIYFLMVTGVYLLVYPKIYCNSLTQILFLTFLGCFFSFMVPRTPWFYHVLPAFAFACMLTGVCLGRYFLIAKTDLKKKMDFFFVAVVNLSLLIVPLVHLKIFMTQAFSFRYQSGTTKMVQYFSQMPHPPSVYCFSVTGTSDCFPLVYLTHSVYAGRGPFFWWLRGMRMLDKSPTKPMHFNEEKNQLINSVAEDLNHYRPEMVIINREEAAAYLGKYGTFSSYFSQNKNFKAAWTHYHFFKQIDHYDLYTRSG